MIKYSLTTLKTSFNIDLKWKNTPGPKADPRGGDKGRNEQSPRTDDKRTHEMCQSGWDGKQSKATNYNHKFKEKHLGAKNN